MDKSIAMSELKLGVCYYPEHWDKAIWQDDLRRMAEHGISTVRVFEFAWSIVQPKEGVYDFSLFDRFLDLARKENINVIMCTPTATAPSWLTNAYPEVLNKTKDGKVMYHGHRRQNTYNSAVYNSYVKDIVIALGKRYGNHPAVIGWQIDNEINCETDEFYSDADHLAFREFLKERFTTLESFNDAIGARFWNQSYSNWDEVYLERYTLHGEGNPHLSLLGKRFFSHSAISFVKMQSEILRKYCKNQFITTNGIFAHLDNHALTQSSLDFMTYDSYPNFGYALQPNEVGAENELKDRSWSMHLSRVRALSPNFGVMEQQSGANGWDFKLLAPMPLPGQMRLWTMQSVSHGADFISYFRWRTAPYGTEIYWHGLNDYDNRPNRRLAELKQVHKDFQTLAQVAGSRYEAKVAILTDYLNEWDGERDKWHGPMNRESVAAIYAAAQHSHTPLDFVNLTAVSDVSVLTGYHTVFYPHAAILTDETAEVLKAYCEQGGTLIMGTRTGYKDEFGRCPMRSMPGAAAELLGVTVIEYTLPHELNPVELEWEGKRYAAPGFQETLNATASEAVAHYTSRAVGMTRKAYQNGGAAYYIGCGFSEELAASLLAKMGVAHPYQALVSCPPEVELCMRRGRNVGYLFLLNYSRDEQTVELYDSMEDMLTGKEQVGKAAIAPFGVMVLKAKQ